MDSLAEDSHKTKITQTKHKPTTTLIIMDPIFALRKALCFQIQRFRFLLNMAYTVQKFSGTKQNLPQVKSVETNPWPQPDPRAFPPGQRILWGYWNSGEDSMPEFNKLCIASWRANNPDWKVIILSDKNYKEYVAAEELPSTFSSLKVQHRSDLVRVAVLVRYGGVYMDVSTICCKGFDKIFESPETPELLITPAFTLSDGVPSPNNALLIAREPNNPILSTFLTKMIAYWEHPATTLEEMKTRPEFTRIFHTTVDKNQGIVAGTELYTANLLILADLLCYDPDTFEYAREHVRYLSHVSWGLPDFRADSCNGVALSDQDMSKTNTMRFWSIMKIVNGLATAMLKDDEDVAQAVYERACVMKVSSDANPDQDSTIDEVLAMNTTYGNFLRKALDKENIDQAVLKDMRDVSGNFVK